jgi:hypothetical protein
MQSHFQEAWNILQRPLVNLIPSKGAVYSC